MLIHSLSPSSTEGNLTLSRTRLATDLLSLAPTLPTTMLLIRMPKPAPERPATATVATTTLVILYTLVLEGLATRDATRSPKGSETLSHSTPSARKVVDA